MKKSFGRGGTGGTICSSTPSAPAANAARSRREIASEEWLLETSLPALLRLAFEFDLPENADPEVALVAADKEAESRELVVGVLV